METPHRYEEREAKEWRRHERQRQIDKVVPPPRATPRSADQILSDARKQCSDDGCDSKQISYEMCGNLAVQIHHLEQMIESLVLDQLDRLDT